MNKTGLSTTHRLISTDSRQLTEIDSSTIDLVVTSPPYPMIAMWDELFHHLNPRITSKMIEENAPLAFELMHRELFKVWKELARTLKLGGIVCINVGDATRTTKGDFQLFANHSRIIEHMISLDFQNLPNIIWRKPTNAPNKFMGSGTLPAGAYVTLEHEYILVFRKGSKRVFERPEEAKMRRNSAFFWEERNVWFSDNWDLKGVKQKLEQQSRKRSAAFPFEVPHRLINMYSAIGDVVLDPFNGTGTTTQAAIANARNSIGIEIDNKMNERFRKQLKGYFSDLRDINKARLQRHRKYASQHLNEKHFNPHHNFAVKTRQEKEIQLPELKEIDVSRETIRAYYS